MISSFKFPTHVEPWQRTPPFAARLRYEVFICSAQFSLVERSTAEMRIPFVPQEAGGEEAAAERCHIAAALQICHFLWSWTGLGRNSGAPVVDLTVFLSLSLSLSLQRTKMTLEMALQTRDCCCTISAQRFSGKAGQDS